MGLDNKILPCYNSMVQQKEMYVEGYRSGHNEAVLKICSREFLQSAEKP